MTLSYRYKCCEHCIPIKDDFSITEHNNIFGKGKGRKHTLQFIFTNHLKPCKLCQKAEDYHLSLSF